MTTPAGLWVDQHGNVHHGARIRWRCESATDRGGNFATAEADLVAALHRAGVPIAAPVATAEQLELA